MFQWTRFLSDGTNITVTLPEDDSIGSTSSMHSTYTVTNVNYTNNGNGFQCSSSGDTSDITYLTGNHFHSYTDISSICNLI